MGVREDLLDVVEDDLRLLRRVDAPVQVPRLVEGDERHRLPVVRGQPLLQRLGVVVRSADQRLAGHLKEYHDFGL